MPTAPPTGLAVLTACALLVAGCAGAPARPVPSPTEPAPAAVEGMRSSVARIALSMVGVPYRYGGDHPSEGFDCSGLVHYAYASSGHAVPRTSQAQYAASRKIALSDARAGDLLFFRDQAKLSHVGIYLGDGQFVHAPSSGDSVRVARLDGPWYRQNLVAVGQLIP